MASDPPVVDPTSHIRWDPRREVLDCPRYIV